MSISNKRLAPDPDYVASKRLATDKEENSESGLLTTISKPSNATSFTRLSRVITACKRCRTKRIKCDKKFPRCANCTKANCENCMSVDAGTGETISRTFIHDLQQQLINSQKEVESLRRKASESGDPKYVAGTSETTTANIARLDPRVSRVSQETSAISDFVKMDLTVTFPFIESDPQPEMVVPSLDSVHDLIKSYFAGLNVQLPIIHREHFVSHYLEPLYDEGAPEATALFFLNMVLAISTSSDQQKYTLQVSNSYKDEAMKYFSRACASESKFERLQSLLLLSQYSMMRPMSPGAWQLVGSSIRLCMEFGFHTEPSNRDNKRTGFIGATFDIEMRRRLYWCCYCLDRQVSIFYGRPFGIDERRVDVSYPSLLDDLNILPVKRKPSISKGKFDIPIISYKPTSLHIIKLVSLQSEILDYIHTKDNKFESISATKTAT